MSPLSSLFKGRLRKCHVTLKREVSLAPTVNKDQRFPGGEENTFLISAASNPVRLSTRLSF